VLLLAALVFLVSLFFLLKLKKDEFKNKKMKKEGSVRMAQVAGQFYPDDKEELRMMAEKFLSSAKQEIIEKGNLSQAPQIIIVPHAGWEYSGQIAAAAFAQINNAGFKRVILVGPSHRAFFEGVATYDRDYWQTPLGRVAVDKALVDKILSSHEGIVANHEVHQNEHCLEVELPFLQLILSDFKIVTVLIGQADEATLTALAQKIAANFDKESLLVVSSDLSHYPDMETAQIVDQQTIKAILCGRRSEFIKTLERLANEYPQVDTFACGQEAIKVGLMVAENLNMGEGKLLAETNSGQITGQTDRVVGYAAIGFYGKLENKSLKTKINEELSESQKKELLKIARETLENYLKNGQLVDVKVDDEALKQKRGVFVTLKKNGQLRGCIGSFFPQKPLYQLVQEMAIAAAVNDHRFPPLQYNELEDIKIEISVLSPLRRVSSPEEIELGKHGVYLKYGARTATFLPQVATETGWSREEFLSQLCAQKAGLPADCYLDPNVELFVYTAQVFGEE